MQPLSKLQFSLLVRIFRNPGVHGYVLLGDTNAAVSSVYDALHKLTARGLVVRRDIMVRDAPMRRCYTITKRGRKLILHGDTSQESILADLRAKYREILAQNILG